MYAVVIVVQIINEGRVDLIERFVPLFGEELVPDGTKKSLYFGTSLRTPGRGVGLSHGQVGAYDFQMAAIVCRPTVRIQPIRDSMAPYGDHQFDDQALGRFRGIKPCADHIAGAIIDDDMQVAFPFFLALVQFRAMHEVMAGYSTC